MYLLAFWASLHLGVTRQRLEVQADAATSLGSRPRRNAAVTLDTDTTVHTLFGNQKELQPQEHRQEKLPPILTFLAETREYISGELRDGDRPTGAQITRHLERVFEAMPPPFRQPQALFEPVIIHTHIPVGDLGRL